MNEEELERLANEELSATIAPIPSPPPATPAPSANKTLNAVNELLDTMTAIDRARMAFFEAESKKMAMLESSIMRRLEEKLDAQMPRGEETDPIMAQGAQFLFQLLGRALQAPPPTPQTVIPPKELPKSTTNPTPEVKTEQPKDVPALQKISDEQINMIADGMFENYKTEVRQFKLGVIPDDLAKQKIMAAGLSEADALRVMDAIRNTDYPMEDT